MEEIIVEVIGKDGQEEFPQCKVGLNRDLAFLIPIFCLRLTSKCQGFRTRLSYGRHSWSNSVCESAWLISHEEWSWWNLLNQDSSDSQRFDHWGGSFKHSVIYTVLHAKPHLCDAQTLRQTLKSMCKYCLTWIWWQSDLQQIIFAIALFAIFEASGANPERCSAESGPA